MTSKLNELAPQAISEIKQFFNSPEADNKAKRVDVALKVLGRINGNESNHLKGAALSLQIAKVMGIKGDNLRPILQDLNPSFANGLPVAQADPAPSSS